MENRKILVRTSKNQIEQFDELKIQDSLIKETKLPIEKAKVISKEVEEDLIKLNLKFVTSPLIREITNVKLLEHGLEKERANYTRLGMPVYDITELINSGSKENANLQFNPETIHKLMADKVAKEYTLIKVLPRHLSDAHFNGEIHIHDLDYFFTRNFCFSHDIRFFLKNGFKADGVGNHTSIAGPAKRPEVAFLHAAKILASAQTNCAGGQGFSYFNTFLAPYIEGMEYKKAKQLAQMFIYEMSQMYVARGAQPVFSSIDTDMSVPKQFLDIPAVQPGGIVQDSVTYANYEDETNMLFNAFVDVYTEGDYIGKPFNFPKFEIQVYPNELRTGKHEEEFLKVSALAAKFGTPYYTIHQPYLPEFACYQCCSFLMPLDKSKTEDDIINGTVRGGGLQVVTINLPQVAYLAKGDDTKFFEVLDDRMDKAKEVMLLKREIIKKNLKNNLLPFMSQKINDKGEMYLEVDKQSYIIGVLGMNEMSKAHTGKEIHEAEGWKFALKVMKYMRDKIDIYSKETELNFALARTPAESCSHRLPQIDRKKYKNFVANGEGDSAYYTNSFHVRPNADITLSKRLLRESPFHVLTTGGAMSHIFLGEENPTTEGIYELTKKIIEKTLIQYYAFTRDMTICSDCNHVVGGLKTQCPKCSSEKIDYWSRITGYMQQVGSWNKGKLAEFTDRRRYTTIDDLGKEMTTIVKNKLT